VGLWREKTRGRERDEESVSRAYIYVTIKRRDSILAVEPIDEAESEFREITRIEQRKKKRRRLPSSSLSRGEMDVSLFRSATSVYAEVPLIIGN